MRLFRFSVTAAFFAAIALSIAGFGFDAEAASRKSPADIPLADVPAPEARPQSPAEKAADDKEAPKADKAGPTDAPADIDPKDVPTPEPRPTPEPATKAEPETKSAPETKPESGKPGLKPETSPDAKTDAKPDAEKDDAVIVVAPRPAVMPADEVACRAQLNTLGVQFEELPQLSDPAGCSVPWPISVTSLAATVYLKPAAVLNCAAAERAAVFVAETVAPASRKLLDATLTGIQQDSAYVCRPRNGTSKLSEHAFGNALDIGAFVMSGTKAVTVGSATERRDAEFLLAIRLAACGPFTTVLGPGSDADHASHFHFDLAKRRSKSAFCQ